MPASASQSGDAPIDLNILPPEYRPRELPAAQVLLAVALALTLALPLIVLGATRLAEEGAASLARRIDAQQATLQAIPTPGEDVVALADEIRRTQEIADRLDALRPTVQAGRRDWPRALAAVADYPPARLRLSRLTQSGDALTIEGWAASGEDLRAYAARLEDTRAIERVEILAETPLPATPPASAAGDSYEPDDALPRAIAIGEVQMRTFDPAGDVDRATFVGKAGRRYCIQALPLSPGVDTVLAVEVAGATQTNDDCPREGVRTACACPDPAEGALGSLASLVEVQPPADGDYPVTVHVENRGAYGPEQRYSLLVSEVQGDAWEHDDDRPQAISPGESQPRTFFPVGDVDRAVLRVKAHRAYRVLTADLSPEVDTHLTVSVGGETLANDDAAPGDRSSAVEFVARADGEAHITVTNRGRDGATAAYSLRVREAALDPYEPDDYVPTPLALWEEQARTLYPEGDIDRAEFPVKVGRTYEVKTFRLAVGVDTVLSVLVAGESFVNDDAAPGERASRVVFTARADGWAGVTVQNAGQFGADKGYSLTVLERAATPTPTAPPTLPPTVTPTPSVATGCQDAHEPDDIIPRLAGVGEVRVHSMCPAGDEDRVVFTAKPGYAYRIETLYLAPGVDTVLSAQLGAERLTNDDRAPQDLSSFLIVHNTSAAEAPVFVAVTNQGAYGPEHTYTLRISDASPADSYEPDEVSPVRISAGEAQRRAFYPAGDVDRAVLQVKAGRRYAVYTCGSVALPAGTPTPPPGGAAGCPALAPGVDTVLLVHGPVAACTPAGCQSDDADPGTGRLNSRVEFEAPSAGEVSISLYNNGAFGAEQHYWLVAEEIGAAAQAPLCGTGRVAGLAAPLVLPTLPPPAPEGGVAFRLRLDLAGVSE